MSRKFFSNRNKKKGGDFSPVLPSRAAEWDQNIKALRTPDNLVAFPSASQCVPPVRLHAKRNNKKQSRLRVGTAKKQKGLKLIDTKSKEIQMKKNVRKLITWIIPAALLLGCATKVSRVQSDSVMDITGRWNDTDSRLVAEQMVKDCLSQRWLYEYQSAKRTPTVIVGKITNKSHEHISLETFQKDIERALLNDGRVQFVASKTERKQLREEVDDQSGHASAETAKSAGEEHGADLMLIGSINTIVDQEGRKAVVFYQVDMELIQLETNMKKWIGNKKIKKYVQRTNTKF